MSNPWPPEFPDPAPPHPDPIMPTSPAVPSVPLVAVGPAPADEMLFEQRRIFVSGTLDRTAVTQIAAQLMAMDGVSSRDVHLLVSGSGGPLAEIFALLDVIDLMRARVNVTCLGAASGTAAALVAAGTGERTAAPHATISLRCDTWHALEGTAGDMARRADEHERLRLRYVEALTAATGQTSEFISGELDRGGAQSAQAAVGLGLIDHVRQPRKAGAPS